MSIDVWDEERKVNMSVGMSIERSRSLIGVGD
jgi:hypothetical protein